MEIYDVVALGELLIDFTENGISEQGNAVLEVNPGGAPGNVLAMLTKLGKKTSFIGKVGEDIFGECLNKTMQELGIGTKNLCFDKEIPTTLAFVETMSDGDRRFSFYRNPGADMMLTKEEIDEGLLEHARIFHFGSLSMTHEKNREATCYAIGCAKKNGAIISFDPNLREPLWKNLSEAREQISYGMAHCDILKISDNEIQWFTKEEDFSKAVEVIRAQYKIPLILVSKGKEGSCAYYNNEGQNCVVECAPFLQEKTIETTGAGDTFCACILNYILEHGLSTLTEQQLSEMLVFANAAASLITTHKGALRVMPSKEEVEDLILERMPQE